MSDKTLVKIKSNFRYIFKAIIESMYTLVSKNCVRFIFSKDKLEIDALGDNNNIVIYSVLYTNNFHEFETTLKDDEESFSQYDVSSLYSALKDAKKSDDIVIELKENCKLEIGLTTKGKMGLISIDPIDGCHTSRYEYVTYSSRPKIVTSGKDFHADCKKLNKKGVTYIFGQSSKSTMKLTAVGADNTALPNTYLQIGHDKITKNSNDVVIFNLGPNRLARATFGCKISDLLKIYIEKDKPIFLNNNLGSLGEIKIYLTNTKTN